MTEPQPLCYLLMNTSEDQANTTRVDLLAEVTCLGRPAATEAGPSYINLGFPNISAQHARILRQGSRYTLENWLGRRKIGLYERSLVPGDTHVLRHCDIFRIPDVEGPHWRIMFIEGDVAGHDRTRALPLEVEYQRPAASVFGEDLNLAPLEYRLLAHLHRHVGELCRWDDVMADLWPSTKDGEDAAARKRQLEVLLVELRKKILSVSGGFTFMETFRGEGIRLVL
jgi:hypothetical protein